MAETAPDPDVLLGRLALHYKLLTKEQVQDALRRYRGQDFLDFPGFLTAEGFLDEEMARKLVSARHQYLSNQAKAGSGTAAEAPRAPVASGDEGSSAGPRTGKSTQPMAAVPVAPAGARAEGTSPSPSPPREVAEPTPRAESPSVSAPAPAGAATAAPAQPPAASPDAVSGDAELGWHPEITLEELLTRARQMGASDLHVHAGATLKLRLRGRLCDASPILGPEETERLIFGHLDPGPRALLEERLQADFSFSIEGVGRFRANAYRQQRGLDAVYRVIAPEPPTLEELGLPADLEKLTTYHQGIVLFTGPAGCGKSSTMAAMIRLINQKRPDHVLVIEDPIEYVHRPERCVVNQRQVGAHTESFARALRAALREDPDVIAIGELRDLETIALSLTAAETGHLVLGTLHTSSAVRTLNRLLGVFPPDQQSQIRTMVSESLRAIVSQRLVVTADGSARIPAIEVMMNSKAIGNLIRDNRTFQIQSVMQTGSGLGNILLDSSLMELVQGGRITREEARKHAEDPKRFA